MSNQQPDDHIEERLSRAISAFSRRQILRLLSEEELTVKDIAEKTNQSVSLASRHLKLLHDLGFLSVKKITPYKFYSLKFKELKELLTIYDKVITKL
jgi:DNA-binding transcriptional ArsR family regulator